MTDEYRSLLLLPRKKTLSTPKVGIKKVTNWITKPLVLSTVREWVTFPISRKRYPSDCSHHHQALSHHSREVTAQGVYNQTLCAPKNVTINHNESPIVCVTALETSYLGLRAVKADKRGEIRLKNRLALRAHTQDSTATCVKKQIDPGFGLKRDK